MADWVTPELLQTLFDRHGAALELFASQWTTAPEDCVQDAMIQLVRQRRSPDCVPAWLNGIGRNGFRTMGQNVGQDLSWRN